MLGAEINNRRNNGICLIAMAETIIGADSMGAMGAIAPMAKKLWGRCP